MKQVVNMLKEQLDYENNYYFYHETSTGCGASICEDGLFLSGFNIINADNLLYTTAAPLTEDITKDEEQFVDFLLSEKQFSGIRQVTEIVVLGFPKDNLDFIVEPTNINFKNENTNNYVVNSQYVLGYVDLRREELNLNPEYFEYYDDLTFSKKY